MPARIDARRLRAGDRPVVRDYFPDPDATERRMRAARFDVFRTNRDRLLVQADADFLPKPGRLDVTWNDLDAWGWLPGMAPAPDDADTRRVLTDHQRRQLAGRLAGCAIHPDSDRALREAADFARARGARVGFLYMPESTEFETWCEPRLVQAGRAHLAGLARDLGVPVIDARNWMDDRFIADGYHLSRAGAAIFTARLGPAVAAVFPAAGGNP